LTRPPDRSPPACATPQSDFALARLTSAGQPDNNFGGSNNGTRVFDVNYANIGYSLVLQPQTTGFPKILIGGYSALSGGTPYMAGGRVLFDGTGTPDTFQSNFSGTLGGSAGDQARQLLVQDDNKILAGGFHTVQTGPYFGIIRLCKDTDPSSCSASGPAGGGDDGSPPPAAPDLVLVVASRGQAETFKSSVPVSVMATPDSPAPPMPATVTASQAPSTDVSQPTIPGDNTVIDAIFALSGLDAALALVDEPPACSVL
jgi:hypothetical protein